MTKDELIAFEKDVADEYCAGKIRAPIHLSDGNEDQLIEIFKNVKDDDWVYSTWRSHYHALLHNIPKEKGREAIMRGESITLMFPEHNFFASAIVGGIVPIAMGTALGIKRKGLSNHVFCFVGDMTSRTGAFYESVTYAENFDLPITMVVEDNDESVGTPTKTVWGEKDDPLPIGLWNTSPKVLYYKYKKQYPHVGAGRWILF